MKLTLHSVTEATKIFLKWLGISIVGFICLFFLFKIGVSIKNSVFPDAPPPPTVAYGKLPPIHFPANATNAKLSFSLDTVTGTLPPLTASNGAVLDRARVFPMIVPKPSLLNLEEAKSMVSHIGFLDQNSVLVPETRIDSHTYQWSEIGGISRQITMDIVNKSFSITSAYQTNNEVLLGINLPEKDHVIQSVLTFLRQINSSPADIDQEKTTIDLFAIKNGGLVPATSLSTAQVELVNLYQQNVEGLPIYYPRPPHSTMRFLVVSGEDYRSIVEAHYFHQPMDMSSDAQSVVATYPIKTSEEAYKELQDHKAYIASYEGNTNDVKIQNISLGYYIGEEPQPALMPVIVFQGSNNFYAYVSAIKDAYIETNEPTPSQP